MKSAVSIFRTSISQPIQILPGGGYCVERVHAIAKSIHGNLRYITTCTIGGKSQKCKKQIRVALKSTKNKKISAMSSAYWVSIKSYGDLFYTLKSLLHFYIISSENSEAMI